MAISYNFSVKTLYFFVRYAIMELVLFSYGEIPIYE